MTLEVNLHGMEQEKRIVPGAWQEGSEKVIISILHHENDCQVDLSDDIISLSKPGYNLGEILADEIRHNHPYREICLDSDNKTARVVY